MQMTTWPVRQKMMLLLVIAFVNFLGSFVLWAMTEQDSLFLLGIAVTMVWSIVLGFLRCPRCRHLAFARRIRRFGFEWPMMGGWTFPQRCASCGLDFNKEYTSSARD